jgi:hypothetical protein
VSAAHGIFIEENLERLTVIPNERPAEGRQMVLAAAVNWNST